MRLSSSLSTPSRLTRSLPKRIPWRWLAPIGLLAASILLQRIASAQPYLVDRFYSRGVYFFLGRLLSQVSRLFSFSIGEVLLVLLPIAGLIFVLWRTWRDVKTGVSGGEIISSRTRGMIWLVAACFLLFLVVWGLNYQRPPLANGLHLTERKATAVELESIARQLIKAINTNYEAARGGDDWSVASRLRVDRERLFQALEAAFQAESLLVEAAQGGFGPPKPVFFSRLMSRFGVSGIFSPFTAEPNYNSEQPDCEIPFAIAHEKAHQRGFAREDEASFVGFLVCIKSADPYLRYSGLLRGLRVLGPLQSSVSPDKYREVIGEILPGVRADLQASAGFWRRARHPLLGRIAEQANNTYLQANKVQSGVGNYGEVVSLIVSYYLTYPEPELGAQQKH